MKRGAKDEKLLEKLTTDQANSASLMARKFFRFSVIVCRAQIILTKTR